MKTQTKHHSTHAFYRGARQAAPLAAGYIPIAMSFGLVSVQAGLSPWAAVLISTLIYAGGSQFLIISMLATGAPLWLVVVLSLLINARHMVYGPNIAPWLTKSRWWPWLMHGLTDQVFALANTCLAQLKEQERVGWFAGLSLCAWASWIGGTALGAFGGEEIVNQWPALGEIAEFALPALFLVLLAPLVSSWVWIVTLTVTVAAAMILSLWGIANFAVPIAALLGCACYYAMQNKHKKPV